MENTPLVIFLEMTKADKKLIESYTTIRIWLQQQGYTTASSRNISGAPMDIWNAKNTMVNEIYKIRKELDTYGILDMDLFNQYMSKKLKEIDEKFPLVDELDN
jgi:hypothetical protein